MNIIHMNFHFSVWLAIIGGILVFNQPDLIVPDPQNLFGPITNNLLIASSYLAVSELMLWYTRYSQNGRLEALLMGLIFILIAGGTKFYAVINEIPVTDILVYAELYIGASHCLYFLRSPPAAVEN
jgi:hypothetical protein